MVLGAILVTAIVSYATLFPIATWIDTAPPDPLLPIIQAKSLGIWGVISGAVSLLIVFLNYKFYGKNSRIDLRERGNHPSEGHICKDGPAGDNRSSCSLWICIPGRLFLYHGLPLLDLCGQGL